MVREQNRYLEAGTEIPKISRHIKRERDESLRLSTSPEPMSPKGKISATLGFVAEVHEDLDTVSIPKPQRDFEWSVAPRASPGRHLCNTASRLHCQPDQVFHENLERDIIGEHNG